MKGKRKCFGLLLALFIMLGLSLSVFSENSSAVSDLTVTQSANVPFSATVATAKPKLSNLIC